MLAASASERRAALLLIRCMLICSDVTRRPCCCAPRHMLSDAPRSLPPLCAAPIDVDAARYALRDARGGMRVDDMLFIDYYDRFDIALLMLLMRAHAAVFTLR